MALLTDSELALKTPRLQLEPVTESHAEELWQLYRDPELHRYVPIDPDSEKKLRERFAKWARRKSPDGEEIWLNWAVRESASQKVMAHFQVGIKEEGMASIGYLVAREFQRKGFATEGLSSVFIFLHEAYGIREVKAWSDSRNSASHALARKLGMEQVETIKDADFFKGETSDEYVFSKKLSAKSTRWGDPR